MILSAININFCNAKSISTCAPEWSRLSSWMRTWTIEAHKLYLIIYSYVAAGANQICQEGVCKCSPGFAKNGDGECEGKCEYLWLYSNLLKLRCFNAKIGNVWSYNLRQNDLEISIDLIILARPQGINSICVGFWIFFPGRGWVGGSGLRKIWPLFFIK